MRILLIDDDVSSGSSLAKFLGEKLGHEVQVESSCESALELYKEQSYPLVISDIKMPGMDGLSLLKQLRQEVNSDNTEVVLITGYGRLDDSIEALRTGAFDYLLKPIDIKELSGVIERVSNKKSRSEECSEIEAKDVETELKTDLPERSCIFNLPGVGAVGLFSDEMRRIRDFALKLHKHREIPVMIEGETGTGKEIVARLVHFGETNERELEKPFISLNCSAISGNLFESELFGYERGAFTGADPHGKAGKLELAQGGTLFLDEIGDMPWEFQPKLLRVLQEREFFRVSGRKKVKLDVRVICASNSNLSDLVEQKKFRRDLYYRLNTAKIQIPPLRERKRDIGLLAQMFLAELRSNKPEKFRMITASGKELLESLNWKGNVRELHSVIERIFLEYNDILLRASYIENVIEESSELFGNVFHLELSEGGMALDEIEKHVISKVLKLHNNNITQSAKYLNISRNRLKRIMDT